MNLDALNENTDALARRYDYGDETVVVADLGVSDEAATIDVADGTVMLVIEVDGEPVQHEFDAPDGTVEKALINNGVVTVEVEQ